MKTEASHALFVWLAMGAAAGFLFAAEAAEPEAKVEVIRLDGLVPDLPITLRESWNAIGIDPDDNVYAMFGGATASGSSDCALFQYSAKTGKRA